MTHGSVDPASILVVDVGGNTLKLALGDAREPLKVPSGRAMSAHAMLEAVREATRGWAFERVSLGFPGPVRDDRPARDPVNLGPGWTGVDYDAALGAPVRMINDAALQALGNHERGRMLFLGLGTGLGTTLVGDEFVHGLEVAHLPYRDERSYEDFVGERGFLELGEARWKEHVVRVVALLGDAMQVDEVVLGGGRVNLFAALPEGTRRGREDAAIRGGVALWTRPIARR